MISYFNQLQEWNLMIFLKVMLGVVLSIYSVLKESSYLFSLLLLANLPYLILFGSGVVFFLLYYMPEWVTNSKVYKVTLEFVYMYGFWFGLLFYVEGFLDILSWPVFTMSYVLYVGFGFFLYTLYFVFYIIKYVSRLLAVGLLKFLPLVIVLFLNFSFINLMLNLRIKRQMLRSSKDFSFTFFSQDYYKNAGMELITTPPNYTLTSSFFYKNVAQSFNYIYFNYILPFNFKLFESFHIYTYTLNFELDGVSLLFNVLVCFITFICLLELANVAYAKKNGVFFSWLFLFNAIILLLLFSTKNIFLFFFLFELLLIPMLFVLVRGGFRKERVRATVYFFMYTILGSLLLISALIFIYFYCGTFDYNILMLCFNKSVTPLSFLIFWLLFFAFAIKVPLVPFHLWLPEAHVEASTAGSILLAAVLLKVGSYGLIRFCLFLFPVISYISAPYIYVLCSLSLFVATANALVQNDVKRIIAYSSVAHMSFGVLGLFSFNKIGIVGSFLGLLGHGLVSAGLFLLIGFLYDRYHTKNVYYYGGLAVKMPLFSFFFFIFGLMNLSFPGTPNFLPEFFILTKLGSDSVVLFGYMWYALVLGSVFNLLVISRILFGKPRVNIQQQQGPHVWKKNLYNLDVTLSEFLTILLLFVVSLFFGVRPGVFTDLIDFDFTFFLLNFWASLSV